MTSCLQACGLYPSTAMVDALREVDSLRYDITKRVITIASLLMGVIGIIMIGVAAGGMAHPAIGTSLILGSFLFCAITGCIGCCQDSHLRNNHNTNLSDFYQLSVSED